MFKLIFEIGYVKKSFGDHRGINQDIDFYD
jgi:hypothetical protein